MDSEEARLRIEYLRKEISRHDYLYYVKASPEISDRDYDKLMEELIKLETLFPEFITPDSPTQRVSGMVLEEFAKVQHNPPMLSLSNTYSKEELINFDQRIRKIIGDITLSYVVEPKIDGVAIELTYRKGIFETGSTRGDGEIGDDITLNLKTIKSIPLRLMDVTPPEFVTVRGEVYMPRKKFVKFNEERQQKGQEPFANPRNAAAGTLKLLDPKEVAKRPLEAIFYSIGRIEGKEINFHEELLLTLQKWGFRILPVYWVCRNIDEVIERLDELKEIKSKFEFDTDGGVIKVNERRFYEILGSTAKSPRWAVAYKYEPERAVTLLKSITIQVGRTGVLTPVAELEPVLLSGTVVTRATLHNEEEIKRKDIRIGDYVIVEKAGEIIPAIIGVKKELRRSDVKEFKMPSVCPECRSPVVKREGEVAYRCENLQCPAQLKRWIEHFASRQAMDIQGMGTSLIDQLVDNKLVNSPADIYILKKEDIIKLERMADKSASNLIRAIENSKNRDFYRVIYALGIHHVGITTAEKLASVFVNIDRLMEVKKSDLEIIPDIGPVVADSIIEFFSRKEIKELIKRLKSYGINMEYKIKITGDKLVGKTFVFTGTLKNFTRHEASLRVKALGGNVSDNINKKISYVIVGENPGSKLDKAKKLNIPVISEEEFIKLIENSN